MIEDPPGGTDDDMYTVAQSVDLVFHAGATVNREALDAALLADFLDLQVYLHRELPGRAEHQSLNLASADVDLVDHRNAEGSGFSGTGSGLHDEILTIEQDGQRLLLDIGRRGVAHVGDRLKQIFGESELVEFVRVTHEWLRNCQMAGGGGRGGVGQFILWRDWRTSQGNHGPIGPSISKAVAYDGATMSPSRVTVIGVGVAGLTTAVCLQERGLAVRIVSRETPDQTTSSVPAALWFPFKASPLERVLAWARAAYERFLDLAEDPATGVTMRTGIDVYRTAVQEPWWRDALPDYRRVHAADLPPGMVDGFVMKAPVIETPIYYPWLLERFLKAGGELETRAVHSFADAAGSERGAVVVNAAGLGARELAGDEAVFASRGHLVYLEQNGFDRFVLDEGRPGLITYVVPRRDAIIVGGSVEDGNESLVVDPKIADAVLERAVAVVVSNVWTYGKGMSMTPLTAWDDGKFGPEDLSRLYKGKPHEGHKDNFYRCISEGGLPVSDVFSHVQALNTCHLAAIAARLGRTIKWDPKAEKIVGDDQAAAFFGRERREGFDILKV